MNLTACLLYAKIHKNKGKNLLHLMLYFSALRNIQKLGWTFAPEHAIISFVNAGIVHRLVYQPSKLRRWVRFPLPAPYRRDAGSFRTSVSFYTLAPLLASLRILKVKKPLRNPKRKEPGGCLPAASRLDFSRSQIWQKGKAPLLRWK